MIARSDHRARWAYGLPGLFLVVALSACTIQVPTVPNWTPTPPEPSPTASPAPESPPNTSPSPSDGRPVQPVPSVVPKGYNDPPPGSGLARYQRQSLEWQACGHGLTCTSVLAPLDYAKPDGTAITLMLARRAATADQRLGTLFINPGGPGASGTSYVGYFNPEGLEAYDIVGWDPRGVGSSTPVACMGPEELDRLNALDASPDDNGEERAWFEAVQGFGRSCLERSGGLLQHVSTVETVKDLELLRGLVGDDKINYFGSSYGTRIGAFYAELYPHRVGRMVLDGSVNISRSDTISQTEGFERALNNFARWCAEERCQLGESKAAVLGRVEAYLDELDQRPLPVGSRTLTQQLGVDAVSYSMYGGLGSWQRLRDALVAAIFDGDGRTLLTLGDRANFRQADGNYDQLSYSFPAVRCLDSQDVSVREIQRRYAKISKAAPVLGRLGGVDLTCVLWPVAPAPPPPTVDGAGAQPIVVIGTTGDPATPYEYAVDMADRLQSAVLITFAGEGHLAYDRSPCVNGLVRDYLAHDRVPLDKSRC